MVKGNDKHSQEFGEDGIPRELRSQQPDEPFAQRQAGKSDQIENGELLNYFDVDLVMNDELLQKYLNENNDSRLKNIVSTIQEEQNDVIRKKIGSNIIVQGVAGSGKTTVALHRIAYLVYNYIDRIRQNQYLVIGPNSIFLNYIKSVLPDLEVDEVKQYTFKDFAQNYEQDIFVEAGRKIRRSAKYADTLSPTERVKEIANIFSSFRNPDKETVLTPWKTVNMHLGDTIGGYNFFDKINQNGEYTIVSIEQPRYITYGEVTQNVLNNSKAKILEINSKSGLYPLYITYSLYRQKCLDTDSKKLTDELEQALWNEVISDNIFVLCKTPMAKTITERTLRGYTDAKTNTKYDSNLLENIETKSQ